MSWVNPELRVDLRDLSLLDFLPDRQDHPKDIMECHHCQIISGRTLTPRMNGCSTAGPLRRHKSSKVVVPLNLWHESCASACGTARCYGRYRRGLGLRSEAKVLCDLQLSLKEVLLSTSYVPFFAIRRCRDRD